MGIHHIPTEKKLAGLGTKCPNQHRHPFPIELMNFQVYIEDCNIKHIINIEIISPTISLRGSKLSNRR